MPGLSGVLAAQADSLKAESLFTVIFEQNGCLDCHLVNQYGGRRGPDFTYIGDELTHDNMVIRIVNGGVNMPAFGNTLNPGEIDNLIAFLSSRRRPTH